MKLSKNKVAIFSDLHLGIYGNSESWHKVALSWADWIAKELASKKIKDILFLGDFFHNRSEISVQTIHVASEILNKLEDFNIIMIVGNHDAFYKNRSDIHSLALMSAHKNVKVVDHNFTINQYDKNLLFVPWNSELPEDKFDYIFGHFEIQNFKMNNFKVCDHGFTANDFLESRTKRVFSGHFHNRNSKKYSEGEIHYVGNTFPMDFADAENSKGYHILDIEDGSLEFFENTVSPRFKKLLVSKIKEYSKDEITNNIVKLIVDQETTDSNLEKIQLYISKNKPFQFHTEYNVTSKSIDDVMEVDSIDLLESINDFITGLKMEDDKEESVKNIIKELYEKNK